MGSRLQTQRPRTFKVTLLTGNNHEESTESSIREVLAFIENTRPSICFEIASYRVGPKPLPSAAIEACRGSAVIPLDIEAGEFHSLQNELGISAVIQPIYLPSTSLPVQSAGIRNLDLTFVCEGAQGSPEVLARWAGEYSMLFHPPKPIHIVSDTLVWSSTAREILEKEFPFVKIHCIAADAATVFIESIPTQLNGIIFADSTSGPLLSTQARALVGSDLLLPSATISLPIQRDSTDAGILGILNPSTGNLKAHDAAHILPGLALILDVSLNLRAEAAAIRKAIRRTMDPIELLGSNLRTPNAGGTATLHEFTRAFMHHLDSYLEAAHSEPEFAKPPITTRPHNLPRRPMGVIEKIMTHAAVGLPRPWIQPGEIITVKVDWTLTSEILWAGMEKTYNAIGRPRLHRNDRMWLAIDHTVDPRTNHLPRQQALIKKAEAFHREAKLVDFLPANTSILHTDFTRERALPGRVVIGCDSHSCSAGCMGALAVGLGAADVVLPMVTGETWFRVPEICRIEFVGALPFGVTGKDVILHILGLFKRNTIAFQRAVEYGGPGLAALSIDARFAIANMTTEFGGMGACFEADERTAEWNAQRPHLEHQGGLYFRADLGAQYAEVREVDLAEVEYTVALHPDPDHVVPVSEIVGMGLDGCFIGACTTTEEDLVTAALVLDAGLRAGLTLTPTPGRRRVTPGSLSIIKNLERHGLLDIYREAGFEIGAPGCSYCVGINDVDVAGEGEVWLSSQNRNFRNRMGKGSIGHVTCAVVVAVSSFGMVVTDPKELVSRVDRKRLERILGRQEMAMQVAIAPVISEPDPVLLSDQAGAFSGESDLSDTDAPISITDTTGTPDRAMLHSRVQRFGENVDTDAIIPAEFVPGLDNADLGSHCFQYYRPEFRQRAQNGAKIIVADRGFGSGSSREEAVRALQGAGIEAVIAPTFAFIYDRNQLNMGMFGITLPEPDFYALAQEGSVVVIDRQRMAVRIEGVDRIFPYSQSGMEKMLLDAGGVLPLYNRFGREVFRQIGGGRADTNKGRRKGEGRRVGLGGGIAASSSGGGGLEW